MFEKNIFGCDISILQHRLPQDVTIKNQNTNLRKIGYFLILKSHFRDAPILGVKKSKNKIFHQNHI